MHYTSTMEPIGISPKFKEFKPKKNPHLHSANHVLADELSVLLNDKKHFGFYLKMATMYDHNVLRRLAGQVLESNAATPGKLFAYLIKAHNQELKK